MTGSLQYFEVVGFYHLSLIILGKSSSKAKDYNWHNVTIVCLEKNLEKGGKKF
jgi:hypothetical protein